MVQDVFNGSFDTDNITYYNDKIKSDDDDNEFFFFLSPSEAFRSSVRTWTFS